MGSLSGSLAVALGAFGAHVLKKHLDEDFLSAFHTGVDYHFYHALALIIVGMLALNRDSSTLRLSGYSFMIGIVLFSGSLYLMALTRMRWLGAITPLGGIAFLAGWIFLALTVKRL